MAEVKYYGTGRRKTSIARVWLRDGDGKISINDKSVESYFPREAWRIRALEGLELTQTMGKFDVFVDVSGGGLTGRDPSAIARSGQKQSGGDRQSRAQNSPDQHSPGGASLA